jgi:hypothetical protein
MDENPEMSEIADDWNIVSRRTNNRVRALLSMLLQTAFMSEIGVYSTVTWTVRHKATGKIRKVTARSERDAKEKIALGVFDKD